MQSESVWLQKALFALRKAETAHGKVADVRDEEEEPYTLALGEESLALEDLEDALEERIEGLVRKVREMRRTLR